MCQGWSFIKNWSVVLSLKFCLSFSEPSGRSGMHITASCILSFLICPHRSTRSGSTYSTLLQKGLDSMTRLSGMCFEVTYAHVPEIFSKSRGVKKLGIGLPCKNGFSPCQNRFKTILSMYNTFSFVRFGHGYHFVPFLGEPRSEIL